MDLGKEVYIGLDTHRHTIHGTALEKNGDQICSYQFPNSNEAIKEFMRGFHPWNAHIALEACNIWRGCYKILTNLGYNVKLANPIKCRQISKEKKTDKVDSRIIAELLRVGFLPEVYIPTEELLRLKDLTRHRINITRLRVRIQNKIKACLLRNGIEYENKIWNIKGLAWLESLDHEEINSFLSMYNTTKKEEELVKAKIARIAKKKEETVLLKTIPGIGDFGAMMIYAEIGTIDRFPDIKHLHAYAGVAPGILQSGSKTRLPTRKQVNYWLKYIIVECAGRTAISKSKLQKYYFKVKKKKGWKVARKSTARKMLTIAWHVLQDKVPYHES